MTLNVIARVESGWHKHIQGGLFSGDPAKILMGSWHWVFHRWLAGSIDREVRGQVYRQIKKAREGLV